MHHLFRLTIVFIVVLLGSLIYIEIRDRQFVRNLPQAPAAPSMNLQQSSPPDLKNSFRETKPTAEVFAEMKEQYQVESSSQQQAPTETNRLQDVPFTQNTETPDTPDLDWQNKEEFSHTSAEDPWHIEDMSLKFKDWYALPEDEQLSILDKGMLKKFGDIPQVQTLMEFDRRPKHLPLSIDEAIAVTEATLYLWPEDTTRQSLAMLKQLKANGFKEFPGARKR
ncbi:MAG: hypothetical protein OXG97_02510 [Candidatus Poribacteria bacterium]|nr:hypothetical protein [Candidatus Poribacteria bacterium]